MEKNATAGKTPELLAPAGSYEALRAAVCAGADAVYFGAEGYNARAAAKNFDTGHIERAAALCRANGVHTYVTMNTLVFDREADAWLTAAERIWRCGIDAFITADIGAALLLKSNIPDVRLHASTQMAAHNRTHADMLASLGFSRVVAARELCSEDLREMCRSAAEIEIFIHGALCVCQSGGCLMSSLVGGRSGNRGCCAQPCRLPYNNAYPLSLKDNCLAGHIRGICTLGAASLKIEGRLKSSDYVYGTVKIYRRLLDEKRDARPEEIRELAGIFSRGGFTDGYFTGNHTDMLGMRAGADMEATRKASPAVLCADREYPPVCRAESAITVHPQKFARTRHSTMMTASFSSVSAYEAAGAETHEFFDICFLPLADYPCGTDAKGVVFPPVATDSERPELSRLAGEAKKAGAVYALCGSAGILDIIKNAGLIPCGDIGLNITNCGTAEFYRQAGFEWLLASPELTLPMLRDLPAYVRPVVCGRIRLMVTEDCAAKAAKLQDRRGAVFPVLPLLFGRREIENSLPTYMGDKKKQMKEYGITGGHFVFTCESAGEIKLMTDMYRKGMPLQRQVRRTGVKSEG